MFRHFKVPPYSCFVFSFFSENAPFFLIRRHKLWYFRSERRKDTVVYSSQKQLCRSSNKSVKTLCQCKAHSQLLNCATPGTIKELVVYWPFPSWPSHSALKLYMRETWGKQAFSELQIHTSYAEFSTQWTLCWICSLSVVWALLTQPLTLKQTLDFHTNIWQTLKAGLFLSLYQANRSHTEASLYRILPAWDIFLQLLEKQKWRVEKPQILLKTYILEKRAVHLIPAPKESVTDQVS